LPDPGPGRLPRATRAAAPRRVVILADDLIWSTRLADAVTAAGGVPLRVRRLEDLFDALADADLAIIDLTARAYDPRRAVAEAAARARVLAVAQHDDVALRKAALGAGAERVLAYRRLAEDGPAVLRAWLGASARAGR
jgi:DNA-binding NarL/FixJ family response regulator